MGNEIVSVPLRGIGSEKQYLKGWFQMQSLLAVSVPLRGIGSEKRDRIKKWARKTVQCG